MGVLQWVSASDKGATGREVVRPDPSPGKRDDGSDWTRGGCVWAPSRCAHGRVYEGVRSAVGCDPWSMCTIFQVCCPVR